MIRPITIAALLFATMAPANAGPQRWHCGQASVTLWVHKPGNDSYVLRLDRVDPTTGPVRFRWEPARGEARLNGKLCTPADCAAADASSRRPMRLTLAIASLLFVNAAYAGSGPVRQCG